MFKTEAIPGLNGRVLNYPRGKVIGGSSAINAMIYMRGQAEDYDGWRQLGLKGWGWDDVKSLMMGHQDHHQGQSEHHGAGGEWRVDKPRLRWDILDAFIEAANEIGIPKTHDFNTGSNEGVGYFEVNQKGGRRWSSARGFLKPILHRPNLTLITGAEAERVLFDGKPSGAMRASGVRIRQDGTMRVLTARREVILSSGAVATPKLLQLSGIGPGALLQSFGIEVVADRPGVGENLQDHLQIRPIYKVSGVKTLNTQYQSLFNRALMGLEYTLGRTGPLTMAPSQLGAFTRSSPQFATPNLQFHVQPLSLDKFGDSMHAINAFTSSVCNLRPESRGHIRIASPAMDAPPAIQPNYLSADADRQVAVDSLKLVRRILQAPALQKFKPEEFKPGTHLVSDEDLFHAAGDIATTIFHPVSTAKMGTETDPTAVLDERPQGARRRGAARRGRLRDAAHHLRQHQFADDHDCREGGEDDVGGCPGLRLDRAAVIPDGAPAPSRDPDCTMEKSNSRKPNPGSPLRLGRDDKAVIDDKIPQDARAEVEYVHGLDRQMARTELVISLHARAVYGIIPSETDHARANGPHQGSWPQCPACDPGCRALPAQPRPLDPDRGGARLPPPRRYPQRRTDR